MLALLIAVLTIATLRLPSAITILLGLVTLALALVTIGTLHPQTTLVKTGGVVVLVFAALGAYLFLSASTAALGGRGYALGRPYPAMVYRAIAPLRSSGRRACPPRHHIA